MAEIKLSFDLTFSRRFMTLLGTAVMMLCAVPELDSESVTLSTYYPAPSGVYTNMITTGNTYLARDGGNVGIGTTSPTSKLHVNGDIGVSAGNMFTSGGDLNLNAAITRSIYLKIAGNTMVTVGATGNVGIGAAASNKLGVTGDVDASGAVMTRQGASCGPPQQITYPTPNGGTNTVCPGQYVTTIAGMYTKYIAVPLDRGPSLTPQINPTVNFICCPCPAAGCSL